ncbi:MAG: molybdopterin synthase catalytic subunit [Rhizobiales bacterium 65-79]|jgi:molybdopterin synthase catalytic subunit|nr:molybdenum cofactor biosynthesis protein MoaE [Hyphomicrobiales bacterium]OJU06608.1 MAG: molybdopterin synthase catalytic subunit [Rhizobiales bacterium 65-79]
MSAHVVPLVRVQAEDFDTAAEIARLTRDRRDVGAVVTFTGLCRDENGRLAALELEHYPAMAEIEIARIASEAMERWPLTGLSVIHRHGRIAPGENIVLVVAASTHRHAAFEAASFLMDYLKSRAPFWKKEHPRQGGEGGWVDAREIDETAAKRWERD